MSQSREAVQVMPEQNVVAAMVAQGLTLMKAENESMASIAVLRPRQETAILKASLAELEIAPDQAKAAYYSIPYKDKKQGGKMVYVQGLSINGATSLARRWGNCAVDARILNEDETGVDVGGYFLDYETNFRIGKPHRASKYRKVGGQWVLADDQRLLMAIQASVSKAQRNAIESGLPAYLTQAYFEKARVVNGGAANVKADKAKVDAVITAFERFKVTAKMLEENVGRPPEEWYGEDVANLRGLFKALLDGGTTVLEIWPPEGATEQPGAVSVESLSEGAVVATDGAKPPTHEPPKAADAPEPPKDQPSDTPKGGRAAKAAELFKDEPEKK